MNIDKTNILNFLWACIVIGIISFFLIFLRQKAKNLATRQDIAKIINKIEGVKLEYAILLQRFSRIHERQVDILIKLYKYLLEAQEYSKLMTKSGIFEGEKPEEYPMLLQDALRNAHKEFAMGRLLLRGDIAEKVDVFFRKIFEMQVEFSMAKHPMVPDGNVRAQYWEKAGKIAYQEIPSLLRIIEEQAHIIIYGKEDA